jgi:tetratricopeptide (TPR) repeat protein
MGFFDTPSRSSVRDQGDVYQEKAALLSETARQLYQQGKLGDAEEKVRELIDLQSRVVGERHPDYAGGLCLLAELLIAQGELHDAEVLVQQAVEVRRKALGERHPDFATAIDMHSRLLLQWEDLDGSEPLIRKALEVRREALGVEHPDYADSLGLLAELLRKRGDLDTAEALLREAVEVRGKASGEDHPDSADGLAQLAEVLMQRGDLDEAEALLRRAAEVYKARLGETHPHHVATLTSLATVQQHKGDLDESEALWRLLLDMWRQSSGEKHPECANILNQLAMIRQRRGDLRGAKDLFRQSLEVRKHALGERHPEYAAGLTQLGLLLQRSGDLAAAEPLLRQALAIRKDVFGTNHPEYATSLLNLAGLVQQRGDVSWARMLLREAVEVRRAVFGADHPEYAQCLAAQAELMIQQGDDPSRAEVLLRQSLDIRGRALGVRHPTYAANLSSLASLMRREGNLEAAEALLREALEIRREVLGERHPDYLTNLGNLAWVLQNRNDQAGAEELLHRSLEIRRQVLGEKHPEFLRNLERLQTLRAARPEQPRATVAGASEQHQPAETGEQEGPYSAGDAVGEGKAPPSAPATADVADDPPPHTTNVALPGAEWGSTAVEPLPQETHQAREFDPYATAASEVYAEFRGESQDSDGGTTPEGSTTGYVGPAEMTGTGPALYPAQAVEDAPAPSSDVSLDEGAEALSPGDQETAPDGVSADPGDLPRPDTADSGESAGAEPPETGTSLAGLLDRQSGSINPVSSEAPGLSGLTGPGSSPGRARRRNPVSKKKPGLWVPSQEDERSDAPTAGVPVIPEQPGVPPEAGHDRLWGGHGSGSTPGPSETLPAHDGGDPSADAVDDVVGPTDPEPVGWREPASGALDHVGPFSAGETPAGSFSMSQCSSLLSQELAALSDRFSELVERLFTAARQLRDPGTPPAEDLIEAVGACRREFTGLRDRARGLAESLHLNCPPAEHLGSLHDLTALLDQAAEAETRQATSEDLRRNAVAVLDRVLGLTHADTPDFGPLRECQEQARALRARIADSSLTSLPAEAERLVEGGHDFSSLLTLVADHNGLSDDLWGKLHDTVVQAFGKPLAAAAGRSKIVLPAHRDGPEGGEHGGIGHDESHPIGANDHASPL